jgi:hypothetical protein
MESVLDIIRRNVCSHCIDANANGLCTLPSELQCPIELYTARITNAIAKVDSDDYQAYVDALRGAVCCDCSYGSPETCVLRTQVDCPLDRYYPMIIDAVEEYLAVDRREHPATAPDA